MSTSTGAFVLAAPVRRKSSRKVLPQYFFGSAAIAGLVLGCAWTVYTNIIAASVYPSVNSADFDAPVVKRPVSIAARPATPSFNDVFASLPPPPVLSKPDTVSPSIMFNERFAAASPQGEPSRVADNAPSIDAAKPVDAPKLAEVSKKVEAPKLAEAPKAKGCIAVPGTPLVIVARKSLSVTTRLNVPARKLTPGIRSPDVPWQAVHWVAKICAPY